MVSINNCIIIIIQTADWFSRNITTTRVFYEVINLTFRWLISKISLNNSKPNSLSTSCVYIYLTVMWYTVSRTGVVWTGYVDRTSNSVRYVLYWVGAELSYTLTVWRIDRQINTVFVLYNDLRKIITLKLQTYILYISLHYITTVHILSIYTLNLHKQCFWLNFIIFLQYIK